MNDTRYDILFEPVQIGPVTAPNRFYAVPHATGHGWNQPHGAIALRAMKAEGGWGTVAVQITEIAADTDMANHPMERIWDDSDVPRHEAQVAMIKHHGSLAAIELGHGGMRCRNITTGVPVIGPSALPVLRPEVPLQARAMTLSDIAAFRASHKAAATRAKRAGYDILYVYAAHDISLLSNFLSIRTNQRADEYGGSFENRLRLLREVLQDTLEVADGRCAVALRFSVAEPEAKYGLRHDGEGRDVVTALADIPDLWDVNISGWSQDSASARFTEEGYQLPYTDFVKSVTDKPVVGVGRFTSPDTMVALVKQKRLDLIGAARPSIADPFLPNKIKNGNIDQIRECIGCNVCVSMDSYGLAIRCTQNPTISEEWRSQWHPEAPAISTGSQSHLIIGAGPAGLECALQLMRAGHKVTIADQRSQAGGRVTLESTLPGLQSWSRVKDYRLHQLSAASEVNLYLESAMTVDLVEEFDADTVVVATGASWRKDGVGSTNFDPIDFGSTAVITPDDVMTGQFNNAPTATPTATIVATNIVVYDDDHFYMGSAIAEALAMKAHNVTYITPLPTIATWTDNTLDQPAIVKRLQKLGVTLLPNTHLGADGSFTNALTGQAIEFSDDTVIALVGARTSNDTLYRELQTRGTMKQLHHAGDCLVPGIIQASVYSGHATARMILSSDSPAKRREQVSLGF